MSGFLSVSKLCVIFSHSLTWEEAEGNGKSPYCLGDLTSGQQLMQGGMGIPTVQAIWEVVASDHVRPWRLWRPQRKGGWRKGSTYRVADPFSSLATFSSSSIGGPVIHPIAGCEHPLLCLLGPSETLGSNRMNKVQLKSAKISNQLSTSDQHNCAERNSSRACKSLTCETVQLRYETECWWTETLTTSF